MERLEAEVEAERAEAERLEVERLEAERSKPSELRLNGPRPNWMTDRVQPWGGVDESVVREAFSGDLPAGWTLRGAEVVEWLQNLKKSNAATG